MGGHAWSGATTAERPGGELASPFTGALPAGWDLRGCALAELADGGLLAVVVAIDKTSGRAAVQPRDRGARPGPEPRRAIGRRRRDVVRALGAGRRPARPAREPGSARAARRRAAVHVRDVQDLRRPGRLALHRRGRSDPTTAAGPGARRSSRPRRTRRATPTTRCGGTRASPGSRPASSSSATTPSATRPGPRARSTSPGARTTARPGPRPPRPGCPGQATYPLPLPDGRLLVFQQRRAETQAMVAVVSDDGGRTFDRDSRVRRLRARRRVGARRGRLAERLRLPDVDGPLHLRPPVRRRHRPERGPGLLVRRRPDPDEHPQRPPADRLTVSGPRARPRCRTRRRSRTSIRRRTGRRRAPPPRAAGRRARPDDAW